MSTEVAKKKTVKTWVIEKWSTFYDWYTSPEKWTFKDYVAWFGACSMIGTFLGYAVRLIVKLAKIKKK